MKAYLKLIAKEAEAAKKIKIAIAKLDKKVFERYKTPLALQTRAVADLEEKVQGHLRDMGFFSLV